MNMKSYIATVGLSAILMLASCGGNNSDSASKGIRFAPAEKTSSMDDNERQAAINAKKAELADINIDSLLNFNGVKFSVLPPAVNGSVSRSASDKLATRIINVAGKNGIGGLCENPVLGLISRIDRTESSVTNTAPQKVVVKYEITLYCGNFVTNDIYASASSTVTGVGATEDAATANAFSEFKDTPVIKEMFCKASENALSWYNNESNISMVVDQAVSEQNYALAMALLSSVPMQATTHEYAVKRNAEVSDLFFQSKADELLSEMKAAIAGSNGEYNPKAGACFALIPHNSNVYAEADKVFAEYCKSVDSDRRDVIARARDVEDRDALNTQLLEMEKLQVEKIKAPFEAQATIAQINADARVGVAQANAEGKKNANTGGFLGLGKFWDHTADFTNKLFFNED